MHIKEKPLGICNTLSYKFIFSIAMRLLHFFILLTCFIFFGIHSVHASIDYDLGLIGADVSFSPDTLIEGESVRFYAAVRNYGANDMSAEVQFFYGPTMIGQKVVSVRAEGYADEVFVDWNIPNEPFNIYIKLINITPSDENTQNNATLTPLFYPKKDTDGDGIPDEIDEDDDNDGLLDSQEKDLRTNPLKKDTDGDGYIDINDAYPLDPNRHEIVLVVNEVQNPTLPMPEVVPELVEEPFVQEEVVTETIQELFIPKIAEAKEGKHFVVNGSSLEVDTFLEGVSLDYVRTGWKTYKFSAFLDGVYDRNATYSWDFGDGTKDKGTVVVHTFNSMGVYHVSVKSGDDFVQVGNGVTIDISWFHIKNPWLYTVLVVLIGLQIVLWPWISKSSIPGLRKKVTFAAEEGIVEKVLKEEIEI